MTARADAPARRASAKDEATADARIVAPPPMPLPDPESAPKPIGFRRAMQIARDSTSLFTELRVDAIVSCERAPEGWRVVVDVVEAAARLGDNDLLSSFEVILDPEGECERFNRIDRYHRSDAAR